VAGERLDETLAKAGNACGRLRDAPEGPRSRRKATA